MVQRRASTRKANIYGETTRCRWNIRVSASVEGGGGQVETSWLKFRWSLGELNTRVWGHITHAELNASTIRSSWCLSLFFPVTVLFLLLDSVSWVFVSYLYLGPEGHLVFRTWFEDQVVWPQAGKRTRGLFTGLLSWFRKQTARIKSSGLGEKKTPARQMELREAITKVMH